MTVFGTFSLIISFSLFVVALLAYQVVMDNLMSRYSPNENANILAWLIARSNKRAWKLTTLRAAVLLCLQ